MSHDCEIESDLVRCPNCRDLLVKGGWMPEWTQEVRLHQLESFLREYNHDMSIHYRAEGEFWEVVLHPSEVDARDPDFVKAIIKAFDELRVEDAQMPEKYRHRKEQP